MFVPRARGLGLGFMVQGSGFRVQIWGLGFRVWGSGFRGLGFRVHRNCIGFGSGVLSESFDRKFCQLFERVLFLAFPF